MVKLKKYSVFFKLFVIFLTFTSILACKSKKIEVVEINAKQIPVTDTYSKKSELEDFITPYREHINKDLDNILSYCPENLNKNDGKWQTPIGNLMADACLLYGNKVFEKREHQKIDLCILNFGGIRAPLNKGNVTARSAYEIMPFENSLIVVQLNGDQINQMLAYFIKEKKAHPLSGITFTITKDEKASHILIQNKPFENSKKYYVVTNDYLANGGDNMNFFKDSPKKFDLDYKIRNVLIDYFKATDTIPVLKDQRITAE